MRYGDPPLCQYDSTYSLVRARKTFACFTCRAEIEPGSVYLLCDDGRDWRRWERYCAACGTRILKLVEDQEVG